MSEGTTAGCMAVCLIIWMGPLNIIAAICCLISALSTSHWLEAVYEGKVLIHGGLFEVCSSAGNESKCYSWDDSGLVDDTVYAKLTIAALILACLGYFLGFFVVCSFVWNVMSAGKPSWGGHSSWGSAWVLNCSGLGMFVKFQHQRINVLGPSFLREFEYGYSFHLCWISLILIVTGCLCTCISSLCCASCFLDDAPADVEEPVDNKIREDQYAAQPLTEPVTYNNDGTEAVKTPC